MTKVTYGGFDGWPLLYEVGYDGMANHAEVVAQLRALGATDIKPEAPSEWLSFSIQGAAVTLFNGDTFSLFEQQPGPACCDVPPERSRVQPDGTCDWCGRTYSPGTL